MRRKSLPWWLVALIDILVIGGYVLSFYLIYYLSPRQLQSSGIQISQSPAVQTGQNDWSTKFADHFSSTVVSEEDRYQSEDISISLQKVTIEGKKNKNV